MEEKWKDISKRGRETDGQMTKEKKLREIQSSDKQMMLHA